MLDMRLSQPGPIYEQIKAELRRLVISGGLSEGEQLPSVRELATHLTINPNTIQRAFRELEAEGYLYASPGKGWFVSYQQDMVDLKNLRRSTLFKIFDETARELLHLGVAKEELSQRLSAGKDDS